MFRSGEGETMNEALKGQVVLVTGGASGIGRAITESFAREGASVVFTYFSSEDTSHEIVSKIDASGGKALALRADLTSDDEVERVVTATLERFGKIDVLITNSGGLLQRSKVAECTRELWDQALAVNLTSMFLCCRAVLPHMERA